MTPLDWARRIAIHYRNTLAAVAPEECAQLDAQARAGNHHWLLPIEIPTEAADSPELLDAALTARDLTHLTGIPANTIHQWAHRGHLTAYPDPDGTPRYTIGDVLNCQARNTQTQPKLTPDQ